MMLYPLSPCGTLFHTGLSVSVSQYPIPTTTKKEKPSLFLFLTDSEKNQNPTGNASFLSLFVFLHCWRVVDHRSSASPLLSSPAVIILTKMRSACVTSHVTPHRWSFTPLPLRFPRF